MEEIAGDGKGKKLNTGTTGPEDSDPLIKEMRGSVIAPPKMRGSESAPPVHAVETAPPVDAIVNSFLILIIQELLPFNFFLYSNLVFYYQPLVVIIF
jgi:hypothetical protein